MAFGLVCQNILVQTVLVIQCSESAVMGGKVKYYFLKNCEHARINAIWQ